MFPHYKHWPSRMPKALEPPATSLFYNLQVSAARHPDRPAVIFLGHVLTWARLHASAVGLAGRLKALGVGRGDRVLLSMQNIPQAIIAHFAILGIGAVVVPANPMSKADELRHYIEDSGSKVAIASIDLAAEVVSASESLPPEHRLQDLVVTWYTDAFESGRPVDKDFPESWRPWLSSGDPASVLPSGRVHAWRDLLATAGACDDAGAQAEDMAVMPYTSGTTGLPKGCMLTHRAIMHNAVGVSLWQELSSESISLLVAPMFHVTGMIFIMHTSVYMGAAMVLMPRWDREYGAALITRHRVTDWVNIPTMIIDVLASPNFRNFDLGSLRFIGGGGAAMPEAVAQKLLDIYGLRYIEAYGLTETASPSHLNPLENPKKQCAGIPFISTDSRIVNPDTLEEMPLGEGGEIVIHGPQLFSGYWNRPEATAAAFMDLDGKRFFRTGDIGRVDEDGYFFLTDRLKRMINASGFKVWPAEIEGLLFKHPAVAEACVIGISDAYRGESVKAVIVLRQDLAEPVTKESIIAWCREHMSAYKVPREIEFADGLPKSGSGKVLWRILQARETQQAGRGNP